MSAISLKSITGITSITTPAGVDNQLTLHTNDTTQRVKVTQSGLEIVGVTTLSHTGANQLVIKDSDTTGDDARMRISFRDAGNTEKFFVGNNNSNGWLYLGSPSGQNNNIAFRVNGSDKFQVNASGAYVNGALTVAGNADIFDSIIHSGDTNTKIRFPAADTVSVETSGSERLRIDSSGRVLIGTTTEGFAEADDLTINSADHGGITIRTPTNKEGNIAFSDTTSGTGEYSGLIRYRHSNDDLGLWTGSNLRLLIDSSGRLGLNQSTPASRLHISEAGSNTITIQLTNATTGHTAGQDGMTMGYSTNSSAGFINVCESGSAFTIKTGGTGAANERLRIDSSGRVLISGQDVLSSTSLSHRLQVKSQSDANAIAIFGRNADDIGELSFYEADKSTKLGELQYRQDHVNFRHRVGDIRFATGGVTERLRIDSSGATILKNTGAATPRSDFFGSLKPISQIASTWNAYHSLTRHDAGSSYGPYLMLAKNRNDAYNSNGAVQDNDECGNIAFLGNDGTAFRESARIRGEVDGTPGSSQVPGAITFATNAGSGVVERLRITSGGDVSIGGRDEALSNYAAGNTTTKLAVVEQYGGSGYSEVAHFTAGTDSNDTGAIVRITQFNNDRGLYIKAGRGTSDQAKAIFGLRNSAASDSDVMTFIQGGKVGINENAPAAQLHVENDNANSSTYYLNTDAALLIQNKNSNATAKTVLKLEGPAGSGDCAIVYGSGSGTNIIFAERQHERLRIDNNGNLKQGTSNPGPFTSSSPTNGLRFLGNKVMQGSVTSTTTLNGSGVGTFDLGKLWTTDDTSIELFIQVVRNDSSNYSTHYAKAFIQKVRGSGMSQGHILYQNGAAAGFSITSISAGGYTGSGHSSHGTEVNVSGGAGGVIYRATCFYTAISKNAQWS